MSVSKAEAAMVLARCPKEERSQLLDEALANIAEAGTWAWDPKGPAGRVLNYAAELADGGEEWPITKAIEMLGGCTKNQIVHWLTGRYGVAYNRATLPERAFMLRELAAKGPA